MHSSLTLSSGQTMPQLGLGTWESSTGEVGQSIEYAITKSGYRHIDCASIYENEKQIGEVFSDIFSSRSIQRSEVFITSKLWNTEHHPDNVVKACKQTLSDLQLDYLDLYLMHWGIAFKHGPNLQPLDEHGVIATEPVSTQETWQAMEQLVDEGLVKSIGISNFTYAMIVDLLTYAKHKPVVNQIEIHPYHSQQELVEYCQRNEIAITAYSPLGRPGQVSQDAADLLSDSAIKRIASSHSKTSAQVLLRWLVQRNIVAIPKSVHTERIAENSMIFDFELSEEEMSNINNLNKDMRLVNPNEWWGIPYFD